MVAMMGRYGSGWGGAGAIMWLFMALFWLGLLALIVRLLPRSDHGSAHATGPAEAPGQVLGG